VPMRRIFINLGKWSTASVAQVACSLAAAQAPESCGLVVATMEKTRNPIAFLVLFPRPFLCHTCSYLSVRRGWNRDIIHKKSSWLCRWGWSLSRTQSLLGSHQHTLLVHCIQVLDLFGIAFCSVFEPKYILGHGSIGISNSNNLNYLHTK
jgi:hypothetical protein